ncbi:MAG: penicillin-binding protein 2 [Candidatus Pacebacteria bacterium]|nr:penicillin-binding protein 2 [Candidatus Paceibacterota bacterium]
MIRNLISIINPFSDNTKNRLYWILVFFVCIALFMVYTLFRIQIVHGDYYVEAAENQYVTPAASVFDRGSIFFQKKDRELVSAATMTTGFVLAINPQMITDPQSVYQALHDIIPLDQDDFMRKAGRTQSVYQEIHTRLDTETADRIRALRIRGVQVLRTKWRSYPGDTIAAHVIGFVGFGRDGNVLTGQYGVERFYDEVLSRNREGMRVNPFAEVFGNLHTLVSEGSGTSGDIVLTIEPTVQALAETTIASISERWSAQETGIIIINPQTGALYAMSKTPAYDLNNFRSVPSQSVFRNTFVENVFEMGSIMKPLVMAAALDVGVISANTSYYDSGSVTVRNRTIFNFDRKGRGQVTMQDVMNQSLNTGMVLISQKMSKQDFKDYMLAFGFGERTGIDLPAETTGLIGNLNTNRDVEYANISFGQGIAVTPISVVRALSALGNGGYLVTPHVVDRIDRPSGLSKNMTPSRGPQVISGETSDEITRILIEVVDSTLLNGNAALDYYSIAAKTGTAQIPSPGGGYYTDRNLHSFFGYFPAYNPQFLIFLYTIHPKGARYASQTLASPFFDMANYLLNYYNVPPDRAPKPQSL